MFAYLLIPVAIPELEYELMLMSTGPEQHIENPALM